MKVYIVRHGDVPHNALKIYNNENEDLNENGVIQAETLKSKIKDLEYDMIISSPLIRAKHTAEIINLKNKKILIDNRLEERNPGDLSGQPLEVTNREEYWNYYTEIQYGTSENIQEFFKRVYNFLDELKQKDYESVLISQFLSPLFKNLPSCIPSKYPLNAFDTPLCATINTLS